MVWYSLSIFPSAIFMTHLIYYRFKWHWFLEQHDNLYRGESFTEVWFIQYFENSGMKYSVFESFYYITQVAHVKFIVTKCQLSKCVIFFVLIVWTEKCWRSITRLFHQDYLWHHRRSYYARYVSISPGNTLFSRN